MAILDALDRTGSARIPDLSREFGVSQITIRRDLQDLDRQGMVVLTRGGAIINRQRATYEPVFHRRLSTEAEEKDRIGRHAASMIKPGATVLLDGGTTVAAMARHLTEGSLTIVSNALNIANLLASRKNVRFIMVGGIYREASQTFLGTTALEMLGKLRVDQAFLGTETFDVARGIEVPDELDAAFKAMAGHIAESTIVLTTSSKGGQARLFRCLPWSAIDHLITDTTLPPKMVASLDQQDVQVHLV